MKQVFVALDDMNEDEIFNFLAANKEFIKLIKIGLEVYLKYGSELIKKINALNCFSIFLDLKLHDIPNTVTGSIRSLKDLKIDFLTLHLSGGHSMLTAAKIARDNFLPKTKLIGVSILTSINEDECLEIYHQDTKSTFRKLIQIASNSEIDGIVCSGFELPLIDKKYNLLTICPGIRLEGESSSDQKRVMTPEKAFSLGATYIVMGRGIRNNRELISNDIFWSSIVK